MSNARLTISFKCISVLFTSTIQEGVLHHRMTVHQESYTPSPSRFSLEDNAYSLLLLRNKVDFS